MDTIVTSVEPHLIVEIKSSVSVELKRLAL